MKITDVRTIPLSRGHARPRLAGRHRLRTCSTTRSSRWSDRRGPDRHRQLLHEPGPGRRRARSCCGRMLIGETGLEPERVAREAAADRRSGRAAAARVEHAISGIDIALWDLLRQGAQPAGLAAARRLLPRPDQALRLDPVRRAARLRDKLLAAASPAASRRSRWAGGRSAASAGKLDELLDPDGPRDGRRRRRADGRRRRQRAVLAARRRSGRARRRRCSATTTSSGSRRPCRPTTSTGFIELRQTSPVPIATGEVLTRRQAFQPFIDRAGGGHHPARPDQVRRPDRRRGASPGWPTTTTSCSCRTAGTRPSAWPPTCASPPRCRSPARSSTRPPCRTSKRSSTAVPARRRGHAAACRPAPASACASTGTRLARYSR